MRYEVRALGIGGILDQTVALIKDNFVLLLGIAAVLYVPLGLLQGLMVTSMTPPPPPAGGATAEEVIAYRDAAMQASVFVMPIALLIGLVGVPLTNAAMIYGVARRYLGEPITVGGAWSHALRMFLPILGTFLLYYLAVFGGLILLIIPGIIFALWFMLCGHAVVIEGVSGTTALKRSKFLMKGNIGQAVVLGLLVTIISVIINSVAGFVPQQHLAIGLGVALETLVLMFSTTAFVIFYFSCRCKAEDFDLVRLAESVHAQDQHDTLAYGGAQ